MRLVQASLALIERPVLAGSFDASVAGGLLSALVDRVEADGAARGVSGLDQRLPGAGVPAARPVGDAGRTARRRAIRAAAGRSRPGRMGRAALRRRSRGGHPGENRARSRGAGAAVGGRRARRCGGAGRRPGRVDLRVRAAGHRSRAAREPRRGAPRFRAAARGGRAGSPRLAARRAGRRPVRPGTCPAACSASTSRWRCRRCAASATIRRRRRCPPRIAWPSRGRWRCCRRGR